ncbi:hypothetical protein GCM10027396_39350 [Insolitispirillum peregrinum]
MAIDRISHHSLCELFAFGRTAKIGARYWKNALFILRHLAKISSLHECSGVKGFHCLKGPREGQYAMRVSGNVRIVFEWTGVTATILEFGDYHR